MYQSATGTNTAFNLTLLPNAPQASTFEVVSTARIAQNCGHYLSCQTCGSTVVDLFGVVWSPLGAGVIGSGHVVVHAKGNWRIQSILITMH